MMNFRKMILGWVKRRPHDADHGISQTVGDDGGGGISAGGEPGSRSGASSRVQSDRRKLIRTIPSTAKFQGGGALSDE